MEVEACVHCQVEGIAVNEDRAQYYVLGTTCARNGSGYFFVVETDATRCPTRTHPMQT